MPLLEGVDWAIVSLFAVLVLLEGLRRVPAGALVLRGRGPAGWRPAGPAEPRSRWRLVSWWSPIAPALVVPPPSGPPTRSAAELEARLGVTGRAAPWLAAGAAVTLVALVLGLPVASARLGALGFLVGAGVVLALSVANACAGALALRRLGPGAAPRRLLLGWCSPFAAGRVLEAVYEAALAGATPAQAVRALAGDEAFAAWARARAYDVVYGGSEDPDLRAAADGATLSGIVGAPPVDTAGGKSFCPRCGATLVLAAGSCPGCAVPLVSLTAAR
jgi:hypothetical protein